MQKVLVLYGSSRENGNSEKLADRVVEGLGATKIYLREHAITPIHDKRHTEEGFQPVDDDYDSIVHQMLAHDVIIFATPVYWYGMSGIMKNFIDRWSQSLRDRSLSFKEKMGHKTAYVVMTGYDQAKLKGLPLVQQFQHIFEFVTTTYGGYIIGEGNKPDDILVDESALFEADKLNRRLRGETAQ
ncbi:flavodoxin family protein [Brevibacillus fluminis]|uniref:Flavodoxin family protein n=1 Tax=Brevibacillus fluminis TaxID=511487 RepID=A0A3M8DRB0_9BACL|nr:flavodoxin family protein [Brevibacillus fluminis]RNB90686.1 flavodoxin family protein [Brevibacillus fluminis]